ncbi:MAG: response regulator [Rhodospirillaceae bacterium]|nr:response regulator [Rhodospirillaceae bacterium]MBT4044264.1 response regulator [Rhodospirillaceae bacterium]MBT4689313.1 response regulator [Rhodospirillaceae bacterium]MBT5081233.1 response regulator [Rhodospirillaceae bacterium]MBT5522635.1 response regulator [Rhodospirillaceae bacterium]
MSFENMSVLIVDDSENMCRILTRLLRSFGFKEFKFAANGQEALDELHDRPVDLAIVDWHMEKMNGIDFTLQMRSRATSPDPYLPIILLTGFSDVSKVKIARDTGVTEILTKPVSPEVLYGRLITLVRQPRPYVETPAFFGPDRRRRAKAGFSGPFRRRRDKGQRTRGQMSGSMA